MSRLIFNNWEWASATHHTSSWGGVLLGQLKANVLYFFTGHGYGPFYAFAGTPMLAVVLGPLVALGLALMLLRSRDDRYAMLALWFWTVCSLAAYSPPIPPNLIDSCLRPSLPWQEWRWCWIG